MSISEQPEVAVGELSDTDRRLILELAAGRGVTEASAAVGVSSATGYRRLRRPAVKAALASARVSAFAPSTAAARAALPKAIEKLVQIIDSESAHASTKIRATEALVNIHLRLDVHVFKLDRIAAGEADRLLDLEDTLTRARHLAELRTAAAAKPSTVAPDQDPDRTPAADPAAEPLA